MPNNLVYHYTSLRNFFNIIENQTFWLTDLWSSMDKNELSYAQKIISSKGKDSLDLDYPLFPPAYNYYALSCTTESDSYFHFNSYGDSCSGVAIGINRNFISDGLADDSSARILGCHLFFSDVLYEQQMELVGNYIDIEKNISIIDDQVLCKAYDSFFPRIKRPEFKLENEVRLVYRQDYSGTRTISIATQNDIFYLDDFLVRLGLEPSTGGRNPERFKFYPFGNRIRKYYEMSFKEFGINNVIKSIIIGPKSKQEEQHLRNYLHARGVDANIIKSELGLRD